MSLLVPCEKGDLTKVKALLKAGYSPNEEDAHGQTPLHLASRYNHEDIVSSLIKKGAKLDKVDKNGCTPLHIAMHHGRRAIVALLLHSGARDDIKDNKGRLPYQLNEKISPSMYESLKKGTKTPAAAAPSLSEKERDIISDDVPRGNEFNLWCGGHGFDAIKKEGVVDFSSLKTVTDDDSMTMELVAACFPLAVTQRRFLRELKRVKDDGYEVGDTEGLIEAQKLRLAGEVDIVLLDLFRERKLGTDLLGIVQEEGVFDIDDMRNVPRDPTFSSWADFFESRGRKLNLVEKAALSKEFPAPTR